MYFLGNMQKHVILIILLSLVSAPIVKAQIGTSPISLALTIYSDGTTKVEYYVTSDPTKVRVDVDLFGKNIDNLVIRDEDGNPLAAHILNDTVRVDSIGATELHITYQTDSLTQENKFIWMANITSPVNVTFILPKNANFLDISEIPINIGTIEESQFLQFAPGSQYVYYILGLPSVVKEANASLTKASKYITQKDAEGYILAGAIELLVEADVLFEAEEYLEAKNSADEALLIATDIIEYANAAESAILSAEGSINEARAQQRTIGLENAEASYEDAISFYESGLYRDAEITAMQAAEEAHSAEKLEQNNIIYMVTGGLIVLITIWIYQKRKSL